MLNIDYEAPADPVNDDDNLVALMFYRATNKPGDAAVLEVSTLVRFGWAWLAASAGAGQDPRHLIAIGLVVFAGRHTARSSPCDFPSLQTGGADAAKKCTVASVPVAGGTVAGTTDVAATCPAGTYSVNNEYCHPW